MISKQTFINTIEAIKRQDKKEQEFSEALDTIVDGRFVSQMSVDIHSALVTVLEEIFQDKDEWISWWMYETSFGQDKKMKAYDGDVDKGGKEIKLGDAGKLYDFLLKNMEDNKNVKKIK